MQGFTAQFLSANSGVVLTWVLFFSAVFLFSVSIALKLLLRRKLRDIDGFVGIVDGDEKNKNITVGFGLDE